MREFFKSLKFKIFAAVACLLIGLMLRTAATGGLPTITQNIISTIISPFQTASSYISSGFSGFINDLLNIHSLKSENAKLKKEISELQSKMVDYNKLKSENERLTTMINITTEKDDRVYTPAMVISRDPGQWFSSFTINKGTLAGIEKDDPVITSEGLVGIVVSPSLTSSVVSTILDPSVHVGSIISQTGDTGITHGKRDLAAKGEFQLNYLPKNSSAAVGDIVITTGIGGIFPKDLKVGIIQKLEQDESGNSLNAILKPMTDMTSVKNVFVITDFSGKADSSSGSSSSTSSNSSSAAKSTGTSSKGGK
ncbi:rod shape-determining protein MreC [[Clostridium] cellulosi]|uniref:Cell shape-determining protein MreC n=1 Tax=[Clostridium] cellulosi TaxID=29343 RepID=A0A078KIM7_9FIRM|nr:MAG: rod shape-determining protein MreC [[Clostridium] cellulosi]CDZ23391.1 rod shape-determining protein MreC [[Clostridium] cellulosi]